MSLRHKEKRLQLELETLDHLVARVVDAVHPLRIILFGSAARGEMEKDSDVDILVVMPEGVRHLETARKIRSRVNNLPVAVDVLVATSAQLERHKDNIGLIYRTILREGREIYAA